MNVKSFVFIFDFNLIKKFHYTLVQTMHGGKIKESWRTFKVQTFVWIYLCLK